MSSNPVSCLGQVQLDQVVQSITLVSFESSLRDGDAKTSLSNLFQRLTILMVKILFLHVTGISRAAIFVLGCLLFCAITVHLREGSCSESSNFQLHR